MNNLSALPYKGTRDYYPGDKRLQNYIFSVWRDVAEKFGYEEYGAPLLEPLELYQAKSSNELANEQTYSFTDRGGRVVAIRPEMTPSVSRMVAAKRQEIAVPARLYSIANFMRYERPQRGREREFWQLNVDIFGVDSVDADAEMIVMADSIMKKFGANASDYKIKINNRNLINYMMAQYLGLEAQSAQAMIKLFDRKDKISKSDFDIQALEIIGEDSGDLIKKINELLEVETMADLPSEIRDSAIIKDIQQLFTILDAAGIESVVFDHTLMRGLDYYTGTVFEVFDTNPENARALFGGGRYDGLVGIFGAEPISAVGMAPGGSMIENFLITHKLVPELKSHTDAYICVIGATSMRHAQLLAQNLRQSGLNVEVDISLRKIDKQIKTADKKHIPYVIFVGENEAVSEVYIVKNLQDSTESSMSSDEIVSQISKNN